VSKCPSVRALTFCAATSLLLVLPGCSSDNDGDSGTEPPPCGVCIRRDTIEHTIDYFEIVWRHSLYLEYEEILHDQFEFVPLERDAADIPWMTGSSWSRTEELTIASHMFDPNFSGSENPLDVIEMHLNELSRRDLGNNHTEVTCTQQGSVITSANNGWSFDTRVIFEIVPDPDEPGLFQILKQTEIDAVALGRVEPSSWGSIKGQFK
jgi:hypothetical protein